MYSLTFWKSESLAGIGSYRSLVPGAPGGEALPCLFSFRRLAALLSHMTLPQITPTSDFQSHVSTFLSSATFCCRYSPLCGIVQVFPTSDPYPNSYNQTYLCEGNTGSEIRTWTSWELGDSACLLGALQRDAPAYFFFKESSCRLHRKIW